VTDSIAIGVDVGGTKVLGVAVDPARPDEVLAEERVATPRGGEALVDAIAAVASTLGVTVGSPGVVGVGVPGLITHDDVLRIGPNLPGIADLALGSALRERMGVEIAVDNDATCATWGEHRVGAGRGVDDLVLVTLGTGIGGGIVAGGRLQHGANGFAGEPGHMIVDPDGPPCPCGRRGCWERYASGSGLGRLARDAAQAGQLARVVELAGGDDELVRGEHVAAAAREGDAGALAVVSDFAWWVALGIANLVNLLDPQLVVVGGGLVEMGDVLLDPVSRSFGELVMSRADRPAVAIVPAELGERAGAIGAALLAADHA
jgi:glucokinase